MNRMLILAWPLALAAAIADCTPGAAGAPGVDCIACDANRTPAGRRPPGAVDAAAERSFPVVFPQLLRCISRVGRGISRHRRDDRRRRDVVPCVRQVCLHCCVRPRRVGIDGPDVRRHLGRRRPWDVRPVPGDRFAGVLVVRQRQRGLGAGNERGAPCLRGGSRTPSTPAGRGPPQPCQPDSSASALRGPATSGRHRRRCRHREARSTWAGTPRRSPAWDRRAGWRASAASRTSTRASSSTAPMMRDAVGGRCVQTVRTASQAPDEPSPRRRVPSSS